MKLQQHELIFGRLKLTLKWTSMNRRKISIGVPGLYYLSITIVSANWYSSTTQLKLQYQLSGIKSGTGCGDDKNCVGINSECIPLEGFSKYKKRCATNLWHTLLLSTNRITTFYCAIFPLVCTVSNRTVYGLSKKKLRRHTITYRYWILRIKRQSLYSGVKRHICARPCFPGKSTSCLSEL